MKQIPKRYFGLHCSEGVAEYISPEENDGKPYRIYLANEVLTQMDPTFEGKPLQVDHIDELKLDNLEATADGYVIKSFYNKWDGKRWVEFMAVSDRAHQAIAEGKKLSNAYSPTMWGEGGEWHAVQYLKELKQGIYNHLALVDDPRYAESVILTPEQFKEYNLKKELELQTITNSKEKPKMKTVLNFFKRTKVESEATADLENTVVTMKNGQDKTILQLVNEMDAMLAPGVMANGDHKVKVGDEEMTVNELVAKYGEMKSSMVKPQSDAGNPGGEEKKNESEDGGGKDMADKKAIEAEKKNSKHFTQIANAGNPAPQAKSISLSSDKVVRGKDLYGSGN